MTGFLSLDVASATGWSYWTPGMDRPHFGTWKLKGGPDAIGAKCRDLHQKMADLHVICPFVRVYMEASIQPGGLQGFTNIQTIKLLTGLCAHVESFCDAYSLTCREVPNTSWKKHFIGRGIRRGTGLSAAQFKDLSMVRCRELGWYPDSLDAADSLGILDYALHLAAIHVPWQDRATFKGAIDG